MFAALKIKDAIVDRLRREQGERPNVDKENPDIIVHAHFSGGRCTLSLDATGSSLHERGYRLHATAAPLMTMARWNRPRAAGRLRGRTGFSRA